MALYGGLADTDETGVRNKNRHGDVVVDPKGDLCWEGLTGDETCRVLRLLVSSLKGRVDGPVTSAELVFEKIMKDTEHRRLPWLA